MTPKTAALVSALATSLVWATASCFGQVILTYGHSNGLYQAGEKVVWTVKPQSASTNASYIVSKNGTATRLHEGTVDLASGSAALEEGLGEPGELVLEVKAGDTRARDGAVVDPWHLKPALPRPDDFDSWWTQKLGELDAIPPNPQLEKVDINNPAIEYCRIALDNIHGTHIRGQLAKPAKEGKFPALLQLQWAGVYPLQRAWVVDRAKAGWLALNVLAHDMPIDDTNEIQRLAHGPLQNYPGIGNTNREESYFLRMYLGDCQALKYLVSRPDWDGKTLVVMGDSMGGQQSFATVGLVGEKMKVTAMICHVPSGADVGARRLGRTEAYPNWPERPEVIETARYFDPVNFAPNIRTASLVSVGLFDGTSPPTGVIAAFNLIAGPKELVPMHSDHQDSRGNQEPRVIRREQWLSALQKGEPAPVQNNS